MLFAILLSVQVIICIALVGVVLLQQSEGGALGMGGGPSGFMTARGAGNLLTRTTWVLAFVFIVNCVGLTILGNIDKHASGSIIDQVKATSPAKPVAPSQAAPQPQSAPPATHPAQPTLDDLDLPAAQPAAKPAKK